MSGLRKKGAAKRGRDQIGHEVERTPQEAFVRGQESPKPDNFNSLDGFSLQEAVAITCIDLLSGGSGTPARTVTSCPAFTQSLA